METFHLTAALAAFGYALAATLSKFVLAKGVGILRINFVMNWVFVAVFAFLLFRHEGAVPWGQLHTPVLTGSLFFLGQVFTFAAIRFGDVSLQTPIMGTKAVFAVILAVVLGTETINTSMAVAAVVSMLGVAFLGFSGDGVERVGRTLTLALLSSFFFAGSDTMVGFYASDFGVPLFLFLAILVNALLSTCLVPFFSASIFEIPRSSWPLLLLASLLMAGQAVLLNTTLGTYQNVAAINVIYSTRGLWSVVLGALSLRFLLGQKGSASSQRIFILRMTGALLMCAAIAILFIPSD
jgi:drug/metabolite transporter (DMT)-like permease